MITYIILFLLLIFSVLSDIKYSKIRNVYVFIAVISGIVINTYCFGQKGAKMSIAGIVLPILVLGIFFYTSQLGAGDIKLFSAIGALLGWKAGIFVMGYSIIAAGVVSLIKLIYSGELVKGFAALKTQITLSVYCGMNGNPALSLNSGNRHVIRLSPYVAAGVCFQLLTNLVYLK